MDDIFGLIVMICLVGLVGSMGGCIGSDKKEFDIRKDCQTLEQFRIGDQVYNCIKKEKQ